MQFTQNEVSSWIRKGYSVERVDEAVREAIKLTGFAKGEHQEEGSAWWNSDVVGAVTIRGNFEGKPAILKIQLVEPTTKESEMITSFAAAFGNAGIRPPHLFTTLSASEYWDGEVMVMEDVSGSQIVPQGEVESKSIIQDFFRTYSNYRQQLARVTPWVVQPVELASERIRSSFSRWRHTRQQLYPKASWLTHDDERLLSDGIAWLTREYDGVNLEFMHGHFSAADVCRVGNNIVLLSNLYWSWRPPLYDLVFGHHWRSLKLIDMSFNYLINETGWWKEEMEKNTGGGDMAPKYRLAMVERALAALNLDGAKLLMVYPEYKLILRKVIEDVIY